MSRFPRSRHRRLIFLDIAVSVVGTPESLLLESGAPDGYLLEDGTGVLLLE